MNTTSTPSETKTKPNIGKRILAGFIDYTIVWMLLWYYVGAFGELNDEGNMSVSGLPALVPVLFWGMVTIGFEQILGSTLGNLIAGLKPVPIHDSTEKLTFTQSLKRHLLDPVDMFFFGAIGIITISNTPLNQRLGDIWAKTTVVNDLKDKKA